MLIRVTVDGKTREADVPAGSSLLDALREEWAVTSVKDACRQGECGSCTVWLDSELVCACLVPAWQAHGREVCTVESLGGGALHPVQEAFLDAGAVQCGFCSPGMVVAAVDLLRRSPHPTDREIREALAGNLCRCTGYRKIVDAVREAAAAS